MTVDARGVVGVVVIGRNEGERLRRCLASTLPQATALVYVDSGSTDGSVDMARAMGADVVALDMAQPFTAARAQRRVRSAAGADSARRVRAVRRRRLRSRRGVDRACVRLPAGESGRCGSLRPSA
jgi:glycosyltransferase involved in cell wall biosynthesis